MQIKMNQSLIIITNSLKANLLNPVLSPGDRLVEVQLLTTPIHICRLIANVMLFGYNVTAQAKKAFLQHY